MKTSLGISIVLLVMTISLSAQSQSQAHSEFTQNFNFEKNTSEKEVTLQINDGAEMLGFEFTSEITKGHLIMTILDPNGKKEGGFELEAVESKGDGTSQSSSSNRNTTGNSHSYTMVTSDGGNAHGILNKHIDNPVAGLWRVVIKTKDLTGLVAIKMAQMSKN